MSRRCPVSESRSAKHAINYATFCGTHQKRAFPSRKAARAMARRIGRDGEGRRMNAYQCGELAGYWHLGHLPSQVSRGLIGRGQIWPGPGVSGV